MRPVTDAHDGTRISRLLAEADGRNQADLDAIAGRVDLSGQGIVFVASGEWQAWVFRVRIDDGEPYRLPFGTSFIEMEPGLHSLSLENGQPRPWHHRGVEIAVDVPTDGHVTLLVTGVFPHHALPIVAPAPGSEGAVWLKAPEPPRSEGDTK